MTGLRRAADVALRSLLVALVAGATLLAVGALVAPATGHRAVILRSGSMAPSMAAGSLVMLESVEPDRVRAGDVVTVVLDSGSLLTHRVVRETILDGYPALVVHGDANPEGDIEVVSLDRLAGRVTTVIAGAGYAAWWLTQPGGLAATVALIGFLLVAIGALGRHGRRSRRRNRRTWRALRRGRFGAQAAALELGLWLGLDKPVLALVFTLVLAFGGAATWQSAAIFTTSTGLGDNTFTTGTWPASDYRSVATGPWSDPATWQRYNGIGWVSATRPPSSMDGVITARNGHVVTVDTDAAADQVVVAAGGQLAIAASVTLAIEDGLGTDLDISGILDAVGTLTVSAGADLTLESGGLLQDSGAVGGSGSITARSGTIAANGGSRTITMPITLSPALTVSGSDDLTLDGELSGPGSLAKTGGSTLTLGAASTYTGATTISVGTVALGTADAIGPDSAVTVASGTILDLNGFDGTVGSLAGAGSVTSSVAGAVTLTTGANGANATFSGVISDGSGRVALTKIGAGTLTLSGPPNTYTGRTTIRGGIISIAADGALGTAPGSPRPGQLTIDDGQLTTTATFVLDGNRGIALSGSATLSVAGTLTYPGVIAGTGALTKIGTGTLALGGENGYTGSTTISSGTLSIADDTALGAAPGSPTPGHLTIGTATLTTTATFDLDPTRGIDLTGGPSTLSVASGTTLTYNGVIDGVGNLVKATTGTLILGGANTYTGSTTISGTLSIADDAALGTPPDSPTPGHLVIGTATLATTADLTIHPSRGITNTGGTGTFSVAAGTTATYGGIIAGTGTLAKISAGTLTLSGASTYSGATTVIAGVIRVQDDDALGSTAGGATVSSGAAIEIDGLGLVIAQPITSLSGTGVGGAGALRNLANDNTWSGTVTFAANSTIAVDGGTLTMGTLSVLTRVFTLNGDGDLVLNGAIAGTTGSLIKNGTGGLTLRSASTYTGATTINEGSVVLGIPNAIGPSSATTVAAGAVLDLNGYNETVGSLAGAGTVTSSGAGLARLTAGGNNTSTTFSGVISDGSGPVALTKAGTLIFTLSGVNTYTGPTTISAGTLSIAADAALGTAPGSPTPGHLTIGTATLTTTASFTLDPDRGIALTGTAIFSSTGTTLTYGGVIAGTGALTKFGTGTLVLGGINTYTGITTITGGVLSIADDTGLGTPPANPTAGRLVMSATLATTATFTLNARRGITLSGTGTFSIAAGTTLTYGGIIAGSGALTKTGTGTLELAGANTYGGLTTVSAGGVLRVKSTAALGTTAGATSVASTAVVEIDGSGLVIAEPISSLIGTGVGSGGAMRNLANNNTWSGAITIGSGNATVNSDAGLLTLGTVGGGARTLTVIGAGDTTVGGVIGTTTGALVKNGSGTLTLRSPNTYTGVTTISGGTVMLGVANAIGPSSAATVAAGALLDLNGFDETLGSLAGAGTVTNTSSAGAILTVGGNGVGTSTFSGVLSDGGGRLALTKIGTGILTLSGTMSTFTGPVTVNAGSISATNDRAFGAAPASPTPGQIVVNGATLATTATFTLDPNRGIALAGSTTFSVTGTLTYAGVITGAGGLTKIGTGTLNLGASVNTYTDATTISAGVISIAADSALGSAPGSPTAGQLAIGTASLATTASFTFNPNRGIAISGTGTFSVAAGTTLTYGGIIAGSGNLTKAASGTLELSGANTYTGATAVGAGIVRVQHDSALGTTAGATTFTSGAAIEIAGSGLVIAEPVSITGTGVSTGGVLRNLANNNTWSGPITATAAATINSDGGMLTTAGISATNLALTVTGAGSTTIGGAIATGTGALVKTGTGTLTLAGSNTYTGVTTISAGTVRVQSATALGTTAGGTTVATGATIEIDGSGLTIAEPITSLIGTGVGAGGALRNLASANTWSGTITLGTGGATISSDGGTLTTAGISATAQTLTVDGSGDSTIGGVIATGTGTLVKNGTGTLTLSGVNTYTGVTMVNVGRLNVNGSTATGAFTIAAGATLGGSGTIGGTISVSGTLAPGSSPGRLTNGALTFVAGATFSIGIGGTTPATGHDQDRVSSGAVTIGGSVVLSLARLGSFTPVVDQAFVILDKVAAGAITGTFNGLPEGATIADFLGSGLGAQISYVGGNGNDIVLTVVP